VNIISVDQYTKRPIERKLWKLVDMELYSKLEDKLLTFSWDDPTISSIKEALER